MGRMGTIAREALQRSGEYCCGLARSADPQQHIFDSLDRVFEQKPDVLLDLTHAAGQLRDRLCGRVARPARRSSAQVDGARSSARRSAALADERGIGALVVPNFSLGASLMMRFAQEAARYFPDAEIVELHHAGKKDKPSGTARETAARIERGERPGARHS